jgi:L-fucose isomerase-like protein
MEILAYLKQHNMIGEIIHGSPEYIARRIGQLVRIEDIFRRLNGTRLGIIGKPSDWLIASQADKEKVREHLGIELIDIPMQTLLDAIKERGNNIYEALKDVIVTYRLQGFTLRCFDLLTTVKDTGCMALARLNSEGYVAGCEGDVPAMLSMTITRVLTGVSGFQANPANINPETGELLFAHCTIPLDMVEHYETDTHFESGIGTAVRGYVKPGHVTIFKMAGDLSRCFVAEGELLECQSKPNLCRTQQLIRLCNKEQAAYFLNNPIGNHHIIMPGHQQELIEKVFSKR